eukprot:7388654-Prymnesium_polylepis.2
MYLLVLPLALVHERGASPQIVGYMAFLVSCATKHLTSAAHSHLHTRVAPRAVHWGICALHRRPDLAVETPVAQAVPARPLRRALPQRDRDDRRDVRRRVAGGPRARGAHPGRLRIRNHCRP